VVYSRFHRLRIRDDASLALFEAECSAHPPEASLALSARALSLMSPARIQAWERLNQTPSPSSERKQVASSRSSPQHPAATSSLAPPGASLPLTAANLAAVDAAPPPSAVSAGSAAVSAASTATSQRAPPSAAGYSQDGEGRPSSAAPSTATGKSEAS
jgi:hypothetical protein